MSGELLPSQTIEYQLLKKLKQSSDEAKLWLSMQSAPLVALAETRKLSNDMLAELEQQVLEHSTLGDVESETLLHELRDLKAVNHHRQLTLLKNYEQLEDRINDGTLQQAGPVRTDAPSEKSDDLEPLLEPA